MQNKTLSTSFVGQNLIKLKAVDSTNNFLKNLLSKSEPLPEGTVIMADDQFAGRGMQDNTWQAEPSKNLTMSLLLRPIFLIVEQQFSINIAVSIAINSVLSALIPNGITIKWPNDIYYLDKKLGGILIENAVAGKVIKSTIIGIGLNVNQTTFSPELSNKATSLFQILQRDVNLQGLLAEICNQIEKTYLQLQAGGGSKLRDHYIKRMYQLHIPSVYRQNGEVFEGIIIGITNLGLLEVDVKGKIRLYNLKEIQFMTVNK